MCVLDDLHSTLSVGPRYRWDGVMADVATLYGSADMPDIDSHNIRVSFES